MNTLGDAPSVRLEPVPEKMRSSIVDIVKGIAITLVVYGHTAQGAMHRGWWTGPKSIFSNAFIYSFHMPTFFFVAGLFVMSSFEKRGSRKFTFEKIQTILYPYILWLLIRACLEPLVSRFKLSPHAFSWTSFILNLLDGDADWFLFTLFCCLMLAMATRRVPDRWRLVIALIVAMIMPAYGPVILWRVAQEFCFVAAGMWVGKRIFRLESMRMSVGFIEFVLLGMIQILIIRRFPILQQWATVILAFTGIAALILLAKLLDHSWVGDSFAWVGQASLGVFLLSPFAQGASREFLLRICHTQKLYLQLLFPTIVAVLLPAIIWHRQEQLHIGRLFHWSSGTKTGERSPGAGTIN
jgi:fucose 4-O-acetylase-like acetyltransferase